VKELQDTRHGVVQERAVLVEVLRTGDDAGEDGHRDRLEELARLADAAGAVVVGTLAQRRARIHPGTYIGSGKIEGLGVAALEALDERRVAGVLTLDVAVRHGSFARRFRRVRHEVRRLSAGPIQQGTPAIVSAAAARGKTF
jgi:hypothetical protein